MRFDTVFCEGEKNRPLVIFIHGMGMDASAWSNPSEARILAGKYPISVLLSKVDTEMNTSFSDLRGLGFSVLSWTQSRPSGMIEIAAKELQELTGEYSKHAGNGIILICHSRGGLIARKYLEYNNDSVKVLITLSTPHHGTSMAKWAVHLSPVAALLNRLLKGVSKKEMDSAIQRILGFFSSRGLRELLPESGFYSELKDKKHKGTKYVSIGGTNPDLLRAVSLSLPELISRVVPDIIIPEEMREGYGDGLVSAASSEMPHKDEHKNFHVNHAAVLFDREVRNYILKTVELF